MGYIRHDAVVATVADYHPDTIARIAEFRESIPEEFRKFLVGPVIGVNGTYMYCFLPDGSKEGWDYSTEAEAYRHRFAEIVLGFRYEDESGPGDAVLVSFGGDYEYEVPGGATVIAGLDIVRTPA